MPDRPRCQRSAWERVSKKSGFGINGAKRQPTCADLECQWHVISYQAGGIFRKMAFFRLTLATTFLAARALAAMGRWLEVDITLLTPPSSNLPRRRAWLVEALGCLPGRLLCKLQPAGGVPTSSCHGTLWWSIIYGAERCLRAVHHANSVTTTH
jgi:hypothetical protein